MNVYAHPRIYEAAFSFRHIPGEVGVMLEACRRHGRIPVERVLEIACGNAPHAPEWVQKGYRYVGLDINETMLAHARDRATGLAPPPDFVHGDLSAFQLPEPVDFACTLLGSLYAASTAALRAHYDCVAEVLRPGGLYLLDWCVDFDPFTDIADSWRIEEDGLWVETTYLTRHVNRVDQIVEEDIWMVGEFEGEPFELREQTRKRVMYPQEFRLFIEGHPRFEFVGWYNDWDLDAPLMPTTEVNRPILVIRRLSHGG